MMNVRRFSQSCPFVWVISSDRSTVCFFRQAANCKKGSRSSKRSNPSAEELRAWNEFSIAIYTSFDYKCWICGKRKDSHQLSLAHIVSGTDDISPQDEECVRQEYALLQNEQEPFRYDSPRNRIVLCGSHGQDGTCHDKYDKHAFSIIHILGDYYAFWFYLGMKVVDPDAEQQQNMHVVKLRPISHNPYRRALYHHASLAESEHTPDSRDKMGYSAVAKQVLEMERASINADKLDDDEKSACSYDSRMS